MNILKVVFVIIGTLIGAGFASGQEMYVFFFTYGIKGILGILVSAIMMSLIIYKSLVLIDKHNIKNYKEFLDVLVGGKNDKNSYKIIKNIINIAITAFTLVTFFIMIAGFGAYFEQEIGINNIIGSAILAVLCFLIFMTNTKGVIKANEILIPLLITILVIVGFIGIKTIELNKLSNYIIQSNNGSWFISSILYGSYNSILLIPVLITLRKLLKDKKQIKYISIISFIIIEILAMIIFLLLTKVDVDITKLEMPAVYVISNMIRGMKIFYSLVILGSIFTTAISLGTSFLQNVVKNKKSYTQIALIMCITSVLVSEFGFSNLINSLYPIFGYIGLIQIFKLLILK